MVFILLREQEDHAERNRLLLKILFDYAKSSGSHFQSENLPDELYVNQMDEEQIWQQLEMQNNSFWEKCMVDTCRLLAVNEKKLHVNIKYADQGSDESEASENEIDPNKFEENIDESEVNADNDSIASEHSENELESENSESGNESMGLKNNSFTKKQGKSVVDDEFFNLNEMEAFLDREDKKELDRLSGKKPPPKDDSDEDSSEEEIDYFNEIDSSDSEGDDEDVAKSGSRMYKDFFDAEAQQEETKDQMIKRKRSDREAKNLRKSHEMKEDLGIDDSEQEDSDQEDNENDHDQEFSESDDDQEKSEFDLRQDRLKKRIEQLEENALAEKPWQLKGEITSVVRPKNSLLEEVLDFESTSRPAPIITEETTLCLEDIIKRRIKSKAWDDVERKIKPINDNQDFRKTLVLSQEKSKESLAQIYEKDYLEKVHKMNNVDDISKQDEPPEHTEIRKAVKDLFVKLDALSNFHFTAKPVAAEAKIITNIPAIEMEEVAPVAVSDATLLAPEEIKRRPVSTEIGKLERTETDKKRERRKKKLKQRTMKQQQDKRIEEKEKLGIKVTTKEKQQQLVKQVTKSRNVIKVSLVNDIGCRQLCTFYVLQ